MSHPASESATTYSVGFYRFALQRQHAEDALVYAAQRFALDKGLQRLDCERELRSISEKECDWSTC